MDGALSASIAKRPWDVPSSSSSSSSPNSSQNPSLHSSDPSHADQSLLSILSAAESPSFLLSLDNTFDRILASANDADHDRNIHNGLTLGKLLLDSANRCYRKRAATKNSLSWPLPPDLTIKVFSMLDIESLIYVGSTCSMFHKFTMDPLCYSDIDLTDLPVNDEVVSAMIKLSGNALRSFRLGLPLTRDLSRRKGCSSLTQFCLRPLWTCHGAAGKNLRRLHVYDIYSLNEASLFTTLSSCPHLTDLHVVDMRVEFKRLLKSVTANCNLLERLFIRNSFGRDDGLKWSACVDFVINCPNLTSLSLRGVALHDNIARTLVKGFRRLKHLDLSQSYKFTGSFLRNLGNSPGGNLLENLELRDCGNLKEEEVARFLASVLAGDFKSIRHIDISNRDGLASARGTRSSYPILPLEKLKEERPGTTVVAKFPQRPWSFLLSNLYEDSSEDDTMYELPFDRVDSSSSESEASQDLCDLFSESSDDTLMG